MRDDIYKYEDGSEAPMAPLGYFGPKQKLNAQSTILFKMLCNMSKNPCVDPDNEGFDIYDLEGGGMVYRFIARYSTDNITPVYVIKQIYTLNI